MGKVFGSSIKLTTLNVNPLKRLLYVFVPPFLLHFLLSYFYLLIVGADGYHCIWSHQHTHSVGFLWTRDRPVAETSTWQHTTLYKERDVHASGGIRNRIASKWAAADHRYRRPVPPTIYKVQEKNMYTGKTNNCTNFGPLLMKIQVVSCWNWKHFLPFLNEAYRHELLSPTSQFCAGKLRNASPDITVDRLSGVISPTDMHKKLFHALKTQKYSVPAAQATATPKIAKSSRNCNNITSNFQTVMRAWSWWQWYRRVIWGKCHILFIVQTHERYGTVRFKR